MSFKKVLARRYRAASKAIRRLVGSDVAPGQRPEQASGHRPETGYFYLGPDLALVRLKNRHILYVDPQDDTMSAQLIAHGHWETWVYAVVLGLVSPGDTVIEVGANLGYYTVAMAAAVGPEGSVTAFEANPRIAALAQRSLGLNGLGDRVTLVPKAVLDQPGEIRFMTSRSHSGGGFVTRWDDSIYDDGVELEPAGARSRLTSDWRAAATVSGATVSGAVTGANGCTPLTLPSSTRWAPPSPAWGEGFSATSAAAARRVIMAWVRPSLRPAGS